MSFYLNIYNKLCESRKSNKILWKPKSDIHRHHITPKHSFGKDINDNYTYLTVREHIIAHFLLWKIYKNPNDLRSMKMLNVKLTYEHRKIIGIFCRDNKIGFHKCTKEERKLWNSKGLETQKTIHNSWYFWSTLEGRKLRASKGGKIGGKVQKEYKQGIHDPNNFKKYASLGGKSIKGMICVTNGLHRTRIKPEMLNTYLSKGYKKGFTLFSSNEH